MCTAPASRRAGVLRLFLAGCSPATGTVTGKVSYNGETLGGGTVVFVAT